MKQRWRIFPRFGLRSILVLTTIVAILCGRWLVQAQRQRDACEQLTSFGASLHMEDPPAWLRWLPEKVLSYGGGHFFCPVTEAELVVQRPSPIQLLANLPRLRLLRLDRWSLGSDGLAGLAGCSQLESLNLSMQHFDNEDLSRLPRLPRLKSLDLSYNRNCSTANLDLPQLESLDLSNTQVNDETLTQIARLTKLRQLKLSSTQVTDKGIASLKSLENLETLELYSTASTGFGIARIRSLKSLVLSDSFLEDHHFSEICELPKLEDLDVDGCSEITDAALARLAGNQFLKRLALSHCRRITQASVETLARIPTLFHVELTGTGINSLSHLERLSQLDFLGHSCKDVPIEEMLAFSENVTLFTSGTGNRFGDGRSHLGLSGVVGLSAKHLERFNSGSRYVNLSCSQFENDVLWMINSWPNVVSLDLNGSSISNDDLEAVGELTKLFSLRLTNTLIDDEGLARLFGLSDLTILSLANTQVSQASMPLITSFSKLETLELPFVPEPESLLKLLANCRSLKELHCCKVDTVGGDRLVKEESEFSFADQTTVNLGDLRLSAKQLERLFALRSFVRLESSALRDEECKAIVSNSELHSLDLSGSSVTDAGAEILSSRKRWHYLDLTNTKVTPDGIRLLCKSSNQVDRLVYDGGVNPSAFVASLPDFNALRTLYYPVSKLSADDARKFLICCWQRNTDLFDLEFSFDSVNPVQVGWMLGESAYDSGVSRLSLLGPLIDDRKLEEFEPSESLEYASASGVSGNPKLLIEKLAACPNLQTLTLDRMPLSIEMITKLKDLKRLDRLQLTGCELDDAFLPKLAELTHVSELILDSNQIQGEQLECFENSMQLDQLSLKNNPLTANARRTSVQLAKQSRWLQVVR